MVCNAKTKLIIIQVIYVSRWGVIANNTLYGSKWSTFSNAKNDLCYISYRKCINLIFD